MKLFHALTIALVASSCSPSIDASPPLSSQASLVTTSQSLYEAYNQLGPIDLAAFRQTSLADVYQEARSKATSATLVVSDLNIALSGANALAAYKPQIEAMIAEFPTVGDMIDAGVIPAPEALSSAQFKTVLESLKATNTKSATALDLTGASSFGYNICPGFSVESETVKTTRRLGKVVPEIRRVKYSVNNRPAYTVFTNIWNPNHPRVQQIDYHPDAHDAAGNPVPSTTYLAEGQAIGASHEALLAGGIQVLSTAELGRLADNLYAGTAPSIDESCSNLDAPLSPPTSESEEP